MPRPTQTMTVQVFPPRRNADAVRLLPAYMVTLAPLYLLAGSLLSRWMAPLPDVAWERAWWPAVLGTLALVFVPTTAWLARSAGTRWRAATALNAGAGHALAAFVMSILLIYDLSRPRPSEGGLRFDVALTIPGPADAVLGSAWIALCAGAAAALLSVPVGALARAVAPRRTTIGRMG